MFKYLNNCFIYSSVKVKVQLYILTCLLFYLLLYYIDFTTPIIKPIKVNTPVDFKNIKYTGSFLELKKQIEEYSRRNKIKILYISSEKKTINVEGKASLSRLKDFVLMLENINRFSSISSFSLDSKKKSHSFKISISFNKFYIKRKQNIKEIPNLKKPVKYKLKAIISDYYLINTKWYKDGSFIDGLKIKKDDSNSIYLINKNKKINLEVYKNAKTRK